MRVLHASTFPDVHLCRVDTSRLEREKKTQHKNGDFEIYISGISTLFYSKPKRGRKWEDRKETVCGWKMEDEVGGFNLACTDREAYHRSVDVPEGSLLAVKDLPLGFILFPVDPADEISQCEKYSAQLSWHQH